MNNLTALKQQLILCAGRAYGIGLQTGSGGNLSARIEGRDQMIIKGSGYSFGECSEQTLVLVDFEGTGIDGETAPSREYLTHAAIYRERPDVAAVMHCHAPWSIAAAAVMEALPSVTHHMEMKLGSVPVLTADSHADLAMAETTGDFLSLHMGIKAFIHRRHGIFSFGSSPAEAEHNAELVEECAKIAMILRMSQKEEQDE